MMKYIYLALSQCLALNPPQYHCYYQGRVVEVEDSSASVDLCSGIK